MKKELFLTVIYILLLSAPRIFCSELHDAVRSGNIEKVKTLFEANAVDVNEKDATGSTPLILAAGWGLSETVSLLLEKGADVDAKDDYGRTALYFAASNGRTEIVKILLDKGADVHAKDNSGTTPFMLAVSHGYTETARFLLECGADVNDASNNGDTALMWASEFGYVKSVMLLLENGAEANKNNNEGVTALMFAVGRRTREKIQKMSFKGKNFTFTTVSSPPKSHTDIIAHLLEKGADINAKDSKGWSAVMLAFYWGKVDMIDFLKSRGAKLTERERKSIWLIYTAEKGQFNELKKYLKKGINVNMPHLNGDTPLMYAAWHGDNDAVKFLLQKGADAKLKNNDGKTALDIAKEKGLSEIVELLEKK